MTIQAPQGEFRCPACGGDKYREIESFPSVFQCLAANCNWEGRWSDVLAARQGAKKTVDEMLADVNSMERAAAEARYERACDEDYDAMNNATETWLLTGEDEDGEFYASKVWVDPECAEEDAEEAGGVIVPVVRKSALDEAKQQLAEAREELAESNKAFEELRKWQHNELPKYLAENSEIVKAADANFAALIVEHRRMCKDRDDRRARGFDDGFLRQLEREASILEPFAKGSAGRELLDKLENTQQQLAAATARADRLEADIREALADHKAADAERLKETEEAHREADKWKSEDDMYGYNFHEGKSSGTVAASLLFYRVRRRLEKALAALDAKGGA